jgi:hypothetical protein
MFDLHPRVFYFSAVARDAARATSAIITLLGNAPSEMKKKNISKFFEFFISHLAVSTGE